MHREDAMENVTTKNLNARRGCNGEHKNENCSRTMRETIKRKIEKDKDSSPNPMLKAPTQKARAKSNR